MGPFPNGYAGINHAIWADNRFVPHVTLRADHGLIANRCAGLNDSVRLNRNARAQLHAWIDNGAWMNAWRKRNWFWRKFQHETLECFRRTCDANLRDRDCFGELHRHQYRGSARPPQLHCVFRIVEKRDLAFNRLGERRCTRNP